MRSKPGESEDNTRAMSAVTWWDITQTVLIFIYISRVWLRNAPFVPLERLQLFDRGYVQHRHRRDFIGVYERYE